QTADDCAAVAFLGQIARVDRRRLARPVRLGLDIAARQGPHLPGAGAETGFLLKLTDLAAFEAARRERDLQVGGRRLLQYLDRGGDDRRAVGQHTLAGDQPADDLAGERQAARTFISGLRAFDRIGDACGVMVLHVLADAA